MCPGCCPTQWHPAVYDLLGQLFGNAEKYSAFAHILGGSFRNSRRAVKVPAAHAQA